MINHFSLFKLKLLEADNNDIISRDFSLPSNDFGVSFESHPDREFLKSQSANQYGCNSKERGMFCAGLIMLDGWEIKKDYPWK